MGAKKSQIWKQKNKISKSGQTKYILKCFEDTLSPNLLSGEQRKKQDEIEEEWESALSDLEFDANNASIFVIEEGTLPETFYQHKPLTANVCT